MRTRSLLAVPLLTVAVAAQEQVDFARDVWPIIESRCLRCHAGPHRDARGRLRKPKAGLTLDSKAGILKGSEDGPVLVAGDAEASPLYARTVLPAGDDDIMPARGKPLTREQTDLLQHWIAAGADFGAWTGAAAAAEAEPAPKPAPPVVARTPERLRLLEELAQGVAPVAAAALAKAAGTNAGIEPVQPGSPLLRVEFPGHEPQVTDADIAALQPIADHVAFLDLGRTAITDRALATVARMARLLELDLHQTHVSDAGLAELAKLGELHSLNLFGTEVTDKGLATIAELPKLRAVYLWQSKVTAAGVQRLREQAAELAVHDRPALPDPEPAGAGAAPRRRR